MLILFFRSRRLAWLIMLHGSWNWSSFMKPKEFVTVWWHWDRVGQARRNASTCFANLSRNAACCTKRCEWILKQLLLLKCLVNLTWPPMTGRMVSFPLYGERLWNRKKWVFSCFVTFKSSSSILILYDNSHMIVLRSLISVTLCLVHRSGGVWLYLECCDQP